MLVLTAAAFNITQHLQGDLNRTTAGQRAFAAANAGVDRALARINSYLPAAATASPTCVAAAGQRRVVRGLADRVARPGRELHLPRLGLGVAGEPAAAA